MPRHNFALRLLWPGLPIAVTAWLVCGLVFWLMSEQVLPTSGSVAGGSRRMLGWGLAWAAAGLPVVLVLLWSWWHLGSQLVRLEQLPRTVDAWDELPGDRLAERQRYGAFAPLVAQFAEAWGDRLRTLERLRSHQTLVTTVLDTMLEGVIAIDAERRVQLANHAAGVLLGFDAATGLGRRLNELVRIYDMDRMVDLALAQHGPQRGELTLDGAPRRVVSIRVSPLTGSDTTGATIVAADVTELRRLESLRQEFVANVSHELKTPLSSIKAYAETLSRGAIHDQSMNLRFVQGIEQQADRLHRLIQDMLSLAKIESGRASFEIRTLAVERLVERSLDDYRPAASAKSISLEFKAVRPGLRVRADEEGMRGILGNLIDNAIKYTPEGGNVSIEADQIGSMVTISVQDTGIGIAPEHLGRLFERFYRVDHARSRELGGTGLGLSIVKHLAQVFGGRVDVASTVGKGSRFTVYLPSGQEGTAREAPGQDASSPGEGA